MDRTQDTLSEVRTLLLGMGFHPSKVLGQNFLIDGNILDIIIKAAGIGKHDCVLEVGPGLGVVTGQLLSRAACVIAVEKDKRLHEILCERFKAMDNFELVCGDALKVDLSGLLREHGEHKGRAAKFVSNLPYSAGNRVLIDLIRGQPEPETIVVTVQKEVAERYAAGPGSNDYGKLSVWIQRLYNVDLVKVVSPTCFWPVPDVKSAIVRMVRHHRFDLEPHVATLFDKLTTEAFTFRRKQIGRILTNSNLFDGLKPGAANELLQESKLDPQSRPEQIAVASWCNLAQRLAFRLAARNAAQMH